MSYSQYGHSRPYNSFSRPRQRSFMPPMSSIHPSKYVKQAVEIVDTPKVEITNSFEDFGLNEQLLSNIRRHGYTIPTPIQDQAIPVIMNDRDVVGIANTGTGKTAAFLLPLLHRLTLDTQEGVLIVVPTRELAVQISDELRALMGGLRFSQSLCVGGLNIEPQIRTLRQNPHFVIGTPGRLKDLIMRGAMDTSMFTNIVLDEVDRMLDIGFLKDVQFLVAQLPKERHSYFFSATMTREVEQVMHSFLHDPVTVTVKTPQNSNNIDQNVVRIEPGKNKMEVLIDLLKQEEFEKVIVFGRTKHGINKLEQVLTARGLKVTAIHGNKSQNARQRSLDQFKKGFSRALLATDVAARGIDIDGVTHVINYDEPNTYEDYIHRIGRTGRAGKMGKALTFLNQ